MFLVKARWIQVQRARAQESNKARNTDPGVPQEAEQQHTSHQSAVRQQCPVPVHGGHTGLSNGCSESDQRQPQADQGVPVGLAKMLNSAVNSCPLEQPGTGRAHTPQCKLPCDTGTFSKTEHLLKPKK